MESKIQKIIIRMPNWIGDLVMATPVLQDIRKMFPKAEITVMCKDPISELLEKDPHIDAIFRFEKHPLFSKENKKIIQKLRQRSYDVGILLTNSFSSAYLFFRGKVKKKIGYFSMNRFFLLEKNIIRLQEQEHLVVTYKKLIQKVWNKELTNSAPKVYIDEEKMQKAKNLLFQRGYEEGKKLVGIHLFSAYGPAKCWLFERFIEVAEKLLKDEELYVVFLGDKKKFEKVKKACETLSSRAINLLGATSLKDLMNILSMCNVFLTNDSGPMHIAGALDVPLVSLFGSTCGQITGPYQKEGVICKKVFCSPCFRRTCDKDFRCMKEIQVEEVVEKIEKKLYV